MKENSQSHSHDDPKKFERAEDAKEVRDTEKDPKKKWNLHTTTEDEKSNYKEPGGIALGSIKQEMLGSFMTWWDRLRSEPGSFAQSDDTPIGTMVLQKESQIYENELVESVLGNFLNLDIGSVELARALKKSNKIYHEDFPGDYILEHNGKRLGMFSLKSEQGIHSAVDVSYEYYPGVKRFYWK